MKRGEGGGGKGVVWGRGGEGGGEGWREGEGVREEGCFVKDIENCVRLLGMFCERDKTGETTHFVVGNILGKSPFLSDMQGSHFILHTARSHIDINAFFKQICKILMFNINWKYCDALRVYF